MSRIFGSVFFKTESLDASKEKCLRALNSLSPNKIHNQSPESQSHDQSHGQTSGGLWISACQKIMMGRTVGGTPHVSGSRRSNLVLDGQIYNANELKLQTILKDDVKEVWDPRISIFHEALEQNGPNILNSANGVFAFAQFESSHRKLTLGVDHFGLKPLFIYQDENHFLFSSEIKAFIAYGGLDLDIATECIPEYLFCGYVSSPRTMYKNISRLAPGHFQTVDLLDGPDIPKKYWDLPLLSHQHSDDRYALLEEANRQLEKSVQRRTDSDSSVGVLMSGGPFSNLIAKKAAQVTKDEKLKTFSVGFSALEEQTQQICTARLVSNQIRSDHFEVQNDFSNLSIDKILRFFDEPLSDSQCLLSFLTFQEAKKYLKIALTGDCAKEVLGLDLDFTKLQPRKNHWFFPRNLRSKGLHGENLISRFYEWKSGFKATEVKNIWNNRLEIEFLESRKQESFYEGIDSHRKFLHLNLTSFVPNGLLPRIDRLSCQNNVEPRLPFLDKDFVEFIFLLPPNILSNIRGPLLGLDRAVPRVHSNEISLSSHLTSRYRNEDFRKLQNLGFRFSKDTVESLKESQLFALYALEGFLKHHATSIQTEIDRVQWTNQLSGLQEL